MPERASSSRPAPAPGARPRNLFTTPLTTVKVEYAVRDLFEQVHRLLGRLGLPLFLAALIYATVNAWSHRAPEVEARHRAEALAFQLLSSPRLEPPMAVNISAAWVRGRVAPSAPPHLALRQAMRFDDSMVLDEETSRVGDFDVYHVWLRLPGERGHWLVTGWVENGDLGVLNLRFEAEGPELGELERTWGQRILGRVLIAPNFRAGMWPRTTLPTGATGPASSVLGPAAHGG
jgi:hypothetical protein